MKEAVKELLKAVEDIECAIEKNSGSSVYLKGWRWAARRVLIRLFSLIHYREIQKKINECLCKWEWLTTGKTTGRTLQGNIIVGSECCLYTENCDLVPS